jgi:formylmethanofuran dehydrogenase subunit C
VTEGITARLRTPLAERADFSEVLAGPWVSLSPTELASRPVELERNGRVSLGDLFEISGTVDGSIRLVGNLSTADRIGAGLSEGRASVDGSVGDEAGMAMSGGTLDISGDAGRRTGSAPPGYKRGMSGGELIVRGSAGAEAGAAMRRGLLVVRGRAGDRTGLGMIAGNIIVFGKIGADAGLWSKRGSVAALGGITPPATYAYACTYEPIHLRLMLLRVQSAYGLRIRKQYLSGLYRRYSGDMAELGKGEILEWTAT